MEHISATRMALEQLMAQGDVAAVLEQIEGRVDLLRRQPHVPLEILTPRRSTQGGGERGVSPFSPFGSSGTLPGAGGSRAGRWSTSGGGCGGGGSGRRASTGGAGAGGGGFAGRSSSFSASSRAMSCDLPLVGAGATGSSGILLGRCESSGFDVPLPFPSRVAVVSACAETGDSVAAALASNTHVAMRPTVAVYRSLEEAAEDSAPVIVFCSSPELRYCSATVRLPQRAPPLGQRRGFVIAGDVDEQTQTAIFMEMHGWCELVRGAFRLRPGSRCSPFFTR